MIVFSSAASMSPTSMRPFGSSMRITLRAATRGQRQAPGATNPATMPPIVGSSSCGNTLFVPVDSAISFTFAPSRERAIRAVAAELTIVSQPAA